MSPHEWFHALLGGCQFMGPGHQAGMEVVWILPGGEKFPGVSDHQGTTGHPFPGSSMGRCQEAPMGHGIPSNHAEHHHWIWEDLWPCHSMDASMSGPLHNPNTHGAQVHAACGWQHWLGLCLCPAEWGPVSGTSVQHGPHQHHDRWHTLHGCLCSTPPASGT